VEKPFEQSKKQDEQEHDFSASSLHVPGSRKINAISYL